MKIIEYRPKSISDHRSECVKIVEDKLRRAGRRLADSDRNSEGWVNVLNSLDKWRNELMSAPKARKVLH